MLSVKHFVLIFAAAIFFGAATAAPHAAVASTTTLRPNASGTINFYFADGTSPTSTNWGSVFASDGDVTYVKSELGTPSGGSYENYEIADWSLPTSTRINSVTVRIRAKTVIEPVSDADPAQVAFGFTASSTDYYATSTTVINSYFNYEFTWGSNPATGLAWTVTDLETLQLYWRKFTACINPETGVPVTCRVRATLQSLIVNYDPISIRENDNLFRGTFLFALGFLFPVWYFKKRNQ